MPSKSRCASKPMKSYWFSVKHKGEFIEVVKAEGENFPEAQYNAAMSAMSKYNSYNVQVKRFFELVDMLVRLNSCPECGNKAMLVMKHIKSPNPSRKHYFVCCCNCKYRKNNEYIKPEKAIADWNSY